MEWSDAMRLRVGDNIRGRETRATVAFVGEELIVVRILNPSGSLRREEVLRGDGINGTAGWEFECQHSPITTLTDYPVDQRLIYGARFCLWCGQPTEPLWENQ